MKNNISLLDIGDRVKQLREAANLSQAQLAKKLDVKSQTVNQWEHGERDLKTGYIIKLANFFGVSADYILCLEDCKTHGKTNIVESIGLSEEAINVLEKMKNDDVYRSANTVLLYCLSKMIENNEMEYVLQCIDQYVWDMVVKLDGELEVLKDFIKENEIDLSLAEIKEYGTEALSPEQLHEFYLYSRRHKLGRSIFMDPDYSEYTLHKGVVSLIDEMALEMIDDGTYYNIENVKYDNVIDLFGFSFSSPYRMAIEEVENNCNG